MFENEEDIAELEAESHILFEQFLESRIIELCYPDFMERMIHSVAEQLYINWQIANYNLEDDDDDEDLLYEFRKLTERFVKTYLHLIGMKRRSYKNPKPHHYVNLDLTDRMHWTTFETPAQRTPAWYLYRHNLITASNIWKVFGSESNVNSLICEKCQPLQMRERSASADFGLDDEPVFAPARNTSINTQSTLHWGVKYEPVTAAIYAMREQVVLGEFGCIPHPIYPFIGASPDGVVMNSNSKTNCKGRMLEIKNVVNREVNGIPSMAYWIQMQIQMEVCNLEECDFVETVFKEYGDTEEELFYKNKDLYEYNGVILYFIKRDYSDSSPKYVYMPLTIELTPESVKNWIDGVKQELHENYVIFRRIYWYCETYSQVLVHRSREWFAAALPKIKDVWATIETERITGCEHRKPKPKPAKLDTAGGCLMDLQNL